MCEVVCVVFVWLGREGGGCMQAAVMNPVLSALLLLLHLLTPHTSP